MPQGRNEGQKLKELSLPHPGHKPPCCEVLCESHTEAVLFLGSLWKNTLTSGLEWWCWSKVLLCYAGGLPNLRKSNLHVIALYFKAERWEHLLSSLLCLSYFEKKKSPCDFILHNNFTPMEPERLGEPEALQSRCLSLLTRLNIVSSQGAGPTGPRSPHTPWGLPWCLTHRIGSINVHWLKDKIILLIHNSQLASRCS